MLHIAAFVLDMPVECIGGAKPLWLNSHPGISCAMYCSWLQAANADPLKDCAADIVAYQNKERTEDVLRIAAFALGVPLERLEGAQLLWLDRLGIYLFAATIGEPQAQEIILAP